MLELVTPGSYVTNFWNITPCFLRFWSGYLAPTSLGFIESIIQLGYLKIPKQSTTYSASILLVCREKWDTNFDSTGISKKLAQYNPVRLNTLMSWDQVPHPFEMIRRGTIVDAYCNGCLLPDGEKPYVAVLLEVGWHNYYRK